MASITYYFDELKIMPGLDIWCYGYAEISGTYEPPDRDVGIMSGWFEWEVESISLQNTNDPGNTPIDPSHPIYKMIVDALHRDCDEYINEELSECSEPDPDCYRD